MHAWLKFFLWFYEGLTAAPINITITTTKNGFELTWTPPFTLPGTEMEFIVEATTNSLSRLLTSQTYQNVSYSDLNISRCDSNQTVHFTIRGVNQVGEGELASIIFHLTPAENVCEKPELRLTQGGIYTIIMIIIVRNPSSLAHMQ